MSGEPGNVNRTQYRLGFWLLLAPIVLWLSLLIILPHIDMVLVSLRERIASRQYGFSLSNYTAFFTEPL
ncbi:MAG: ABC transporter permease, partial [Marinobacter sp.]